MNLNSASQLPIGAQIFGLKDGTMLGRRITVPGNVNGNLSKHNDLRFALLGGTGRHALGSGQEVRTSYNPKSDLTILKIVKSDAENSRGPFPKTIARQPLMLESIAWEIASGPSKTGRGTL